MVLILAIASTAAACSCDRDARTGRRAQRGDPPPAPAPPPDRPSGPPERVTFTTSDGVTIVATLRAGGTPDAPAAILVHQLDATRAEWDSIVEELARAPGLTILALDLRGHGESTSGAGGRAIAWRDLEGDEWLGLAGDVRAAVQFLAEHPALEPSRITVAGSSIGSTAAIAAAATEPRIAAVAAISPGRAYRGFDAMTPATRLGERPLLTIAAEHELPAARTALDLDRIASRGEAVLVPGDAHGLAIVAGSPDAKTKLVDFLRNPGP